MLDERDVATLTVPIAAVRSRSMSGRRPAGRSAASKAGSASAATPAATQARGRSARRPRPCDHVEQAPVLQERQPAGAEVVEQRAERLGPDRHLRGQRPGAVEHAS